MNKKTVTSSLALLLSVASVGVQQVRAQDTADTSSQVSDSQPPADGQSATDVPASDSSTPPPEQTAEPAAADANPYEASAEADASVSSEDTSASETTSAPVDPGGLKLRWGAQLGYMFHTDPKNDFRSAKWLPIGAELGLGMGKSPFALVIKADASPLCFGGHDCSGLQFRGLAGIEVGIQKAEGSALHMVYLNASLGYRYAKSEIENAAGSTSGGKLNDHSMLISEVSASMMIPVTRTFSIGPRVALSSNLTSNTKEGVSALQLGVRILHAPGQ